MLLCSCICYVNVVIVYEGLSCVYIISLYCFVAALSLVYLNEKGSLQAISQLEGYAEPR